MPPKAPTVATERSFLGSRSPGVKRTSETTRALKCTSAEDLFGNPPLPANFQSEGADGWQQYVDACSFWINNMVGKARPFQEKMTLFWHGHFVSAWWDVAKGFHLLNLGDHRQLELSLPVYDALYAWCKNEVAAA